jgi:hypothetical protein
MTLSSSKKEGSSFPQLIGSRAQVWHGTAYKTTGGLTKRDLMMSHGRVVSRKKHFTAKKEKRLEKAGYFAKKGSFGFIKKTLKSKRRGRKMRGGVIGSPSQYPSDDMNENESSPYSSDDMNENESSPYSSMSLDENKLSPNSSMSLDVNKSSPYSSYSKMGGRRKRKTRRTCRRLRGGKLPPLSSSAFEKH